MLILSRKLDEEIVINGNIIIKVIEIKSSKVKLGIAASKDTHIMRKELLDGSR